MKSPVLVKLIAIGLGIMIFWGATELACRVVFSTVVSYDVEMWRYARRVKMTGRTPGLRFEHRPDVRAQLMGVVVATNSDGLREREISRDKSEGTVRIAVVGDSITFGWGVPQNQTYVRQLEEILNVEQPVEGQHRYETLNFGVGNYAISDVANMLEYKALSYHPDLIIYGAFLNDAESADVAVSSPWILHHSLSAVWLWGRVDRLLRMLGLREDYLNYYLDLYKEGGAGQRLVRDEMQRMARLCAEKGIPLIVAFLPELHTHLDDPFSIVTQVYRQEALDVGAIFVDLRQGLPDNGRETFWVSADDAHPNARAMALYAPRIVEKIPWSRVFGGQGRGSTH